MTLAFLDDPGQLVPVLVLGGSMVVAVVAILAGISAAVLQSRDRERTRREVAAYLAEGSITDDQADRLLRDSTRKRKG